MKSYLILFLCAFLATVLPTTAAVASATKTVEVHIVIEHDSFDDKIRTLSFDKREIELKELSFFTPMQRETLSVVPGTYLLEWEVTYGIGSGLKAGERQKLRRVIEVKEGSDPLVINLKGGRFRISE